MFVQSTLNITDSTSSSKQREQPKVPCQIEMEVDRISNLPENIVDTILSFLPLRDAGRSSILSSKWRYKWTNLTSLVFEDVSVAKIVDHVLLLHNGPIYKFQLSEVGVFFSDINRWILFLSRGSLKEFIIRIDISGSYYQLPSSFYLCDKLSHLELFYCRLEPPSAFNVFKILTSLVLCDILMDQNLLENLIYMCPLLERLTLRHIHILDHLKIHAPRLTFFEFESFSVDVTFENTVHLSNVSIFIGGKVNDHNLPFRNMSTLIKFFASLPNIQRLNVNNYVLEILAGDTVPRRLPTPSMKLNYLSLPINFDDMEQCLATLCILRSSPNLVELKIISCKPYPYEPPAPRAVTKNLMELEDYQNNCFFNRLRFVVITGIYEVPRELNFIEFLLANSPILERMTVKRCSQDSGVELFKELLRFRRASAHAEIIFLGR